MIKTKVTRFDRACSKHSSAHGNHGDGLGVRALRRDAPCVFLAADDGLRGRPREDPFYVVGRRQVAQCAAAAVDDVDARTMP